MSNCLCNCEPIINLTPHGTKLKKNLEYCLYFFVILTIFKIFFIDFNDVIGDLILFLIMILTIFQVNYIFAILLVFLSILHTFGSFLITALLIQNHFLELDLNYIDVYYLYTFFYWISLIYYITLTRSAFEAYKEFKAIYMETSNNSYSKYI